MTHKLNNAELVGVIRARELIRAISQVRRAASSQKDSSLSGTLLYFAGAGNFHAWTTDGTRIAQAACRVESSSDFPTSAVVSHEFLGLLRSEFDRDDLLEVFVRDESIGEPRALLVRRLGEATILVQPTWTEDSHMSFLDEISQDHETGAMLAVRGRDLLKSLGDGDGSVFIHCVDTGNIEVKEWRNEDGIRLEADNTFAGKTLEFNKRVLREAVESVVNLKFPMFQFDQASGSDFFRAYGTNSKSVNGYGPAFYWMRGGAQDDLDRTSVRGGGGLPPRATIEKPGVVEPLAKVLEELNGIVGQSALKSQVNAIVRQVKIQKIREEQGLRSSAIGGHMVFSGPPGTGKTTVARLIARLMHSLGVLPRTDVLEVDRAGLVAQHIGGTEEKTTAVIEKALGGVLFIDEAYSLSEGGPSDFGHQAIEVLLKAMEDKRSEFVCIIAGYTERINGFLDSNPGLKSRFGSFIEFEPYDAAELVAIAESMFSSTDNEMDQAAEEELLQRLKDEESRGTFKREDWGNARVVRNIVDSAIRHRDMRVSDLETIDRESLITVKAADIARACDECKIGHLARTAETVESVLTELNSLTGQHKLKAQVEAIVTQARLQVARRELGLPGAQPDIDHIVFTGPPGTGKTTIARLFGRLYRALGLLPSTSFVEADRSTLVGRYIGETAVKTSKAIDRAIGGVLFIDEAYSLARGTSDSNDFGREVIDTLVPRLENERGQFLAIMAGYPDDMERLLDTNPGLRSRFTTRIDFVPYSAQELCEIGVQMAKQRGETMTDEAKELFESRLTQLERSGAFERSDWGNAREVRTIVSRMTQQRDLRIASADLSVTPEMLTTLTGEDVQRGMAAVAGITDDTTDETVDEILAKLDSFIGQLQLKAQIRRLLDSARAAKDRTELGIEDSGFAAQHMLFTGPPGTGKTTIARLMARLYKALGFLGEGHLVEVDRSDLVGQYVGQTAPKTNAKINEAMGGVLFIDEAYTLVQGNEQDFGMEAVNTLLKRMSDDQGNFLVIAAGYPNEMRGLVDSNPGLARRFPVTVEFESYSPDELTQIASVIAAQRNETLTTEAINVLRERLLDAAAAGKFQNRNWGNAGVVENIIGHAQHARNSRIYTTSENQPTPQELTTITAADIALGCSMQNL